MRHAVVGTGTVGQAMAGRLASLGHEAVMERRDAGGALARTEPDHCGNPPPSG